jgi:hypothetical protein
MTKVNKKISRNPLIKRIMKEVGFVPTSSIELYDFLMHIKENLEDIEKLYDSKRAHQLYLDVREILLEEQQV